MKLRRILSFLLALLMTFSTFAEMIPANVFASETQEEAEQTESTGEIIASYEIPLSDVGISEDGGFIINLPETVLPDAPETEPARGRSRGPPCGVCAARGLKTLRGLTERLFLL